MSVLSKRIFWCILFFRFLFQISVIKQYCELINRPLYKQKLYNGIQKKVKWLMRSVSHKGTDKQYVAEFFIHSTTSHIWCLYQISKF